MHTMRECLGQIILCKGCCCGRTENGLPEVPVERIKGVWRTEKLNCTIQLTISGCLGPCDVPNVVLIITPEATIWLGRISGDLVLCSQVLYYIGREREVASREREKRYWKWAQDYYRDEEGKLHQQLHSWHIR